METDFAQLNIDGALISEFKVVPSMKLVMTLLRGPEKQNERMVQTEHDLQFNFVKGFKIAFAKRALAADNLSRCFLGIRLST
jgi:hypothetical protein